jgi:hypothetical protein
MGLFGSRAPAAVAPSAVKTALPITSAAPEPPKTGPHGLFGSSWANWESLATLGAALQEMGGSRGALNARLEGLRRDQADALARQRQASQDVWTKQTQQHQTSDWQRGDQAHAAAATWAQSLPEGPQRAAAVANPDVAYEQYAQHAFDSPDTPLTAEQARQYGLQPGTSAVMRDGRVEVLQTPYHPPASIIMQGQNSDSLVDWMADYVRTNGSLPQGAAARNPDLVRRVYERVAQSGAGAGEVGAASLNFSADRQGLGRLRTTRTMSGAAERSALSTLQLAQQLSRQVPRTDYPAINRMVMTGRTQTGDTPTAQYVNALIAARTEYAKVLSGSTGAQGITDAARREANEMFSQYASPEQLDGLVQTASQEMHLRMQGFDAQEQELLSRVQQTPQMGNRQPAPAPQSGAPHAGDVQDGYRFRGGNPADRNSWEPVR